MGDRTLPSEHLPDDRHVVPEPLVGMPPRLPVPALRNPRPGQAEPTHHPSGGQRLQRPELHCRRRRGTGRNLGDRAPQPEVPGVGCQEGQGGDGIGTVDLSRPDRVEAQALRQQDPSQRQFHTGLGPDVQTQSELHDRSVPMR